MINILKSKKQLTKFCNKRNKLFRCQEAFSLLEHGDCDILCPLIHILEIEQLMELKNLPLGEAFRLTLRKEMPGNMKKVLEYIFGADFKKIQEEMLDEEKK